MTKEDFMSFEYILCMDESNLRYRLFHPTAAVFIIPVNVERSWTRQSLKALVSCVRGPSHLLAVAWDQKNICLERGQTRLSYLLSQL